MADRRSPSVGAATARKNLLRATCAFGRRRIKEELEALDRKAREVLRHSFPAEKIAALPLTELALDQDESYGVFALGYDTGETLAGRLYLFVPFDEDFQPCGEPICELC